MNLPSHTLSRSPQITKLPRPFLTHHSSISAHANLLPSPLRPPFPPLHLSHRRLRSPLSRPAPQPPRSTTTKTSLQPRHESATCETRYLSTAYGIHNLRAGRRGCDEGDMDRSPKCQTEANVSDRGGWDGRVRLRGAGRFLLGGCV